MKNNGVILCKSCQGGQFAHLRLNFKTPDTNNSKQIVLIKSRINEKQH